MERRVRREDGGGGVGRSRDREKGRGEGRRKREEEEGGGRGRMSGRRNGTDEQMGNEKGRGAKWKGEERKERRERSGKRGGRGTDVPPMFQRC